MTVLISGTGSGLGKYLLEELGGVSWNRQTSEKEKNKLKRKGVDVIIHCAFNSSRPKLENITQYFEDNVLLTKELLSIPHQRFIFISSVDVYPKNLKNKTEEALINLEEVNEIYPLTKLISEEYVKKISKKYLILRCSGLLGKFTRKNSLIRILTEEKPVLTLSSNSQFNYILHSDVKEFIDIAIKKKLTGVYNLTSSKNINLGEISKKYNKNVQFGSHIYDVGRIDNSKAKKVLLKLGQSSKKIIKSYFELTHKL